MDLFYRFRFEAARRLPKLPAEHPCARLHGHSFKVEVQLSGPLARELGWVCDFAEIEAACNTVRQQLDHRTLNEVAGLENPTSELIALWLWERLKPALPQLSQIEIQETDRAGCIYRGPDAALAPL